MLIFINYIETFSIFPGIVLNKQFGFISTIAWSNALTFLIFNCFDTIGKYLGIFRQFYSFKCLSITILLRIACIVIGVIKPVIKYDWIFLMNIIIVGFSNGFLTTALMILSSEKFSLEREKEISGFLACFMLNFGCIAGSLVGLLFDKLFDLSL